MKTLATFCLLGVAVLQSSCCRQSGVPGRYLANTYWFQKIDGLQEIDNEDLSVFFERAIGDYNRSPLMGLNASLVRDKAWRDRSNETLYITFSIREQTGVVIVYLIDRKSGALLWKAQTSYG